MTFAQKMRELRDAKGISEAKLAELSGLPFGTLHVYAIGRSIPSFPSVVAIARALGVTCEAFSGCEDVNPERKADEPAKAKPAPKKPAAKRKKP
ncbi:MAG: helix-turn-helix transcriptional regulator [Gemmataceae bacterium]